MSAPHSVGNEAFDGKGGDFVRRMIGSLGRNHLVGAMAALGASGFALRRIGAPEWMDTALSVAWAVMIPCVFLILFNEWRREAAGRTDDGEDSGGAFGFLFKACLIGFAVFLTVYVAFALWSGGDLLAVDGWMAGAGWLLKALLIGLAALWIFILTVGLATTAAGLMAIFAAVFTLVIVVPSLAALLAADFLYPEAVVSAGWTDMLWLVAPASLASVILFDFVLDGIIPRSLRIRIQTDFRFGTGEAIGRGVFFALTLLVASRLVPDSAGVSVGAALAAGAVSAFVRYYLGLYFGDSAMPISRKTSPRKTSPRKTLSKNSIDECDPPVSRASDDTLYDSPRTSSKERICPHPKPRCSPWISSPRWTVASSS